MVEMIMFPFSFEKPRDWQKPICLTVRQPSKEELLEDLCKRHYDKHLKPLECICREPDGKISCEYYAIMILEKKTIDGRGGFELDKLHIIHSFIVPEKFIEEYKSEIGYLKPNQAYAIFRLGIRTPEYFGNSENQYRR